MVEKGFDPATTLFANTFITGELIELGNLFVKVHDWENRRFTIVLYHRQ